MMSASSLTALSLLLLPVLCLAAREQALQGHIKIDAKVTEAEAKVNHKHLKISANVTEAEGKVNHSLSKIGANVTEAQTRVNHRDKDPFDDPFFKNHKFDDPFFHRHHQPSPAVGLAAAALPFLFFCCCCCCPIGCLCRGHFKASALREKRESLTFQHPAQNIRQPAISLSDGMQRLAQENCVIIQQKVNMLQELSTHLAGYSIQTANSFEVLSAAPGAEQEVLLACREVQDATALLAMNLGGALAAAGIDAGNAYADRSKAPFRIAVGLPQASTASASGLVEVTVPEGVTSGQQMQIQTAQGGLVQVAVPPGVAPGSKFQVQLPDPALKSPGQAQQVMQGLVHGTEQNIDAPFLYLDRPFAFDCMCLNRPQVEVFDMRGGAKVKLGVISDPFAWMDMTFNLHVGPNATSDTPPSLSVRGAACQPGAVCQCLGLCCGRHCQEAYLEVVDPQNGDKTVAFITKGWAGGMKEMFTSANSFLVDFGEVQDPACKALLLATALFVNYRFFEGAAGAGNRNRD